MTNGLVKLRKDAGLSRFQLARQLNNTPGSIRNWEKGISDPSSRAVYKMAKIFGVTTDDIFLALNTTNVVENK